MARGDMDQFFASWGTVHERVKAIRIMKLIDKLPGEEKGSARFFYEMLCDFVHPNVGAHTLVRQQDTSHSEWSDALGT